ncbi:MAG: DUF3127 domain-containing protein [Bacteroidetes bacterium]|nr:DUF3127 domain-containing protein [Bacteroidota bacterium]
MSLEVTGKLLVKYDTQNVSDKFKKREFVLELAEEINGNVYTNFAKMQLVQNKCEILDKFNQGDMVKVSFNIKGNRWERDGKVNYITNLDAWRIENAAMASQSQPMGSQNYSSPAPSSGGGNFYNPSPENVDDLPF